MALPPIVKKNIQEHLTLLKNMNEGDHLHYVMVRPKGSRDSDVKVWFDTTSKATTKAIFQRKWAADGDIKASDPNVWQVMRGAIQMGKKGLTTIPAIRGNQVMQKGKLKSAYKDLRDALKGQSLTGVNVLKDLEKGEYAKAMDTSKLDDASQRSEADEPMDDEKDFHSDSKVKSSKVKKLIDRYRQLGIREAVQEVKDAKDRSDRNIALDRLEEVRKNLMAVLADVEPTRTSLKSGMFGSSRNSDSLEKLDELMTRAQSAIERIDDVLGLSFEGQDLATTTGKDAPDDTILTTLRGMVQEVRSARGDTERVNRLIDLFMTADMWLKEAGEGSGKRERQAPVDLTMKPKVQSVYEKAAKKLCDEAGITINQLPAWLATAAGRGMSEHGTKLDVEKELAWWMTANQREVFRCHVKGGKLYQYPWWDVDFREIMEDDGDVFFWDDGLEVVDSAKIKSSVITPGYTGFVMSMAGDLYLTIQEPPTTKSLARYHSSYLGGQPILMAGELLISGGKVVRMNTRSGHYQPPTEMMIRALKLLKAQGVAVEEVADFNNQHPMKADLFLSSFGHLGNDGAANAAQEHERAKQRHKIFFAKHFAAQSRLLDAALADITRSQQARAERQRTVNVHAYASPSDEPKARQLMEERAKTSLDYHQTLRDHDLKLEEMIQDAAGLKTDQAKHAAETRKDRKDITAPTARDGYVDALDYLMTKGREVQKALAIEQGAIRTPPTTPPMTAPWDLRHHGKISRSEAEARIVYDGFWLLRYSDNVGGWVVTTRQGGLPAHHEVKGASRAHLLATYPPILLVPPL